MRRRPAMVHRTLVAAAIERASRTSSKQVGVAVAYHQVRDQPADPGRELVPVVSTDRFVAQVDHLVRTYDVVPASRLMEAAGRRRRGQRFPVAITFDDDLRSHVDVVAPLLAARGVQATFFLCGASLHQPFSFWWERLQRMPLSRERIRAWAGEIEDMSPAGRREVAAQLAEAVGPDPEDAGLRAADVAALIAAGQEIGFHTRDHDPLPVLDDEALDRALTVGTEELSGITARPLRALAYPHGRADERVAAAAARNGYTSAFTTGGGAATPSGNPLLIGRVDPSPYPPETFALAIARTILAAQR